MRIHFLGLIKVGADIGAVSVIAAKTTITLAEILFISLGLVVVVRHVAIDLLRATSMSIGVVILSIVVIDVLVWQRVVFFVFSSK